MARNNTIHILRDSRQSNIWAFCGFKHRDGSFTTDASKSTCPQCIEQARNHRATIKKRSRAKNNEDKK